MSKTKEDDDAYEQQAPSTPLERNVFGAYPFSKEQEEYIVQLREEQRDRLQWSEISKKFNERYPGSPRSKGALQVHYSRSLQPGKRAKSRRDRRPSSASSAMLQQLCGPPEADSHGEEGGDEGANRVEDDNDGSRLPNAHSPMAESEGPSHSTRFTPRTSSRHTHQNASSNIDSSQKSTSAQHTEHFTKQQTSKDHAPWKSDLEIQQLLASGNKRARTQKPYQEAIEDSHQEVDESSLSSLSDSSSATDSADLFSHLDVIDISLEPPPRKRTPPPPPASVRRKLVLKLNKQTSKSQKEEPPQIRLADTERLPFMPHQEPEEMEKEAQKPSTRSAVPEARSIKKQKHKEKDHRVSTTTTQSEWTIVDPAELSREEFPNLPAVFFNPPPGRIVEMSRNGARTRSRKAGEKLPVFESGFYKEPWYYPGDVPVSPVEAHGLASSSSTSFDQHPGSQDNDEPHVYAAVTDGTAPAPSSSSASEASQDADVDDQDDLITVATTHRTTSGSDSDYNASIGEGENGAGFDQYVASRPQAGRRSIVKIEVNIRQAGLPEARYGRDLDEGSDEDSRPPRRRNWRAD